MYQAHLIISGRVQGVCYRVSCVETARSLKLSGWVKNLSSGQVQVLAQGSKEKIEKLIEWCKKGPQGAEVKEVTVEWQDIENAMSDFIVVR